MSDYQHQIVLLNQIAEPEIIDSEDTNDKLKILTGQGFPPRPNTYYKQRCLKKTFNFFTMPAFPEVFDLHTYKNDDHMSYINKKWLRSHFDIVENWVVLTPKRKCPYSIRMAAKFLLEEAYLFDIGTSPSKNQLLGKRTAEEAFGSIDSDDVDALMPRMIYSQDDERRAQINSDWSDYCCTKKKHFLLNDSDTFSINKTLYNSV